MNDENLLGLYIDPYMEEMFIDCIYDGDSTEETLEELNFG